MNAIISKNFISLGFIHIANIAVPIVTIPFLINALGLELYGAVILSMTISAYFFVIIDYGFNLNATKEVSINKEKISNLNSIFNNVIQTKLVLIFFCFFLCLFLISFEDSIFSKYKYLILLSFLSTIFQSLSPLWFLQGIQRMEIMALLEVIGKSISLLCIIFFIESESDYLLVPLIYAATHFILLCFYTIYLIKNYKIRLCKFMPKLIFQTLKDGASIFYSRFAVSGYTRLNIIALGILVSEAAVGIFSIFEKVINSIARIGSLLGQAYYPEKSFTYSTDKNLFYKMFRKMLFLIFAMMILLLTIYTLASEYIFEILASQKFDDSYKILSILFSINLLFIPLGTVFTNFLAITDNQKKLFTVTTICFICNLLLLIPSLYFFELIGAVLLSVFIQALQVVINITYFIEIKKKDICAA